MNLTRKLSGERSREGFWMNCAQYMSNDRPASRQFGSPHPGRALCADLPGHLNKLSNEAYGSRLMGLPVYNSPFSGPSWFLMWWHFLLGRGHQDQACSTLVEGTRAETSTETWKLEGRAACSGAWQEAGGRDVLQGLRDSRTSGYNLWILKAIAQSHAGIKTPPENWASSLFFDAHSAISAVKFQITDGALPVRVFLNGAVLPSWS